jgi:hypothetical protein
LDDLSFFAGIPSGQTVTGNLCFEIATSDASSLLLSGWAAADASQREVWFALR